jgi:methyl-accepting chemotaxis protein
MRNFMVGWSIKKRLYFFSAVLAFNLLVVSGFGVWSQNEILKDLVKITTVDTAAIQKLTEADSVHNELRALAYRAIIFGESASAQEKTEMFSEFRKFEVTMRDNVTSIETLIPTQEIKQLAAVAQSNLERYISQVKGVVDFGLAGQKNSAFGKVIEMQTGFESVTTSLGALIKVVEVELDHDKEHAIKSASSGRWASFLAVFVGLVMSAILSWWLVRRMNGAFSSVMAGLGKEAADVSSAAGQIGSQSQLVSSATHEQASALQETAASIEEITAMVKKTAENSKKLESAAMQSSSSAERGKASVASMIQAVGAIRESNEKVLKQVEAGNTKITEIVRVISEIGNKTKVINDIVFQTKLLSFNASVEAARAGEHGKGFAVVAEEVGNLAQMSGTAAKEISDMLASSIAHVENIVSETKRGVDHLVVEGRTKVDSGIEVANQAGRSLGEIVNQVSEVSSMVNEITTAIQEQTQGIHEISKAIGQLDAATQMNSKASKEAEVTSGELTARSKGLKQIVDQLEAEVFGSSALVEKDYVSESVSSGFTVRDSIVLPFKRPESPRVQSAVGAIAVGGDVVPAEDDPRFEDV